MKLFLIWQSANSGYDTYDSAVVAAEDELTARLMNPRGGMMEDEDWKESYSSWCSSLDEVEADYLGKAKPGTEREVICASFNAG